MHPLDVLTESHLIFRFDWIDSIAELQKYINMLSCPHIITIPNVLVLHSLLTSCPSCLAGKGEEHRTQKTQLLSTHHLLVKYVKDLLCVTIGPILEDQDVKDREIKHGLS